MPTIIDQSPSQGDSPQIPEMQRLKKKYPQYKDVPDYTLLQGMAKKFPVYQKPFQEIADKMDTSANKDVSNETQKNNLINGALSLSKDTVAGMGNPVLGRVLRPLWGAVQSTVAGKSPIEGFKNPDEQQSFGVSYSKAYNLDLNKPAEFASAVVADVVANVATAHLLYGVPAGLAKEGYTYAKNAASDHLHSTLVDELKKAGASQENSKNMSDVIVNHPQIKKMNPITLMSVANNVKNKLGDLIKNHIDAARTGAQSQGYSPEIFKKLGKIDSLNNQLQDLRPAGNQINMPTRKTAFGDRYPVSSVSEPTIHSVIPLSDGRSSVIKQLMLTHQTQQNIQTTKPIAGKTPTPSPKNAAPSPPSLKTIPSTQPGTQLRPAIKVKDGEYAIAKPGEHHDDIISRRPDLKNKQHGFVDQNNKFLTRTEAAKIIGQKSPLHSEDIVSEPLNKLDDLKIQNKIKEHQTNIDIIKEDLPHLQMGEAHEAQSHIEDFESKINDLKRKLVNPVITTSIPPIKSEEIQKSPQISDEVLQRQGNQDPKVLAQSKQIKTIPTPEISKDTTKPQVRQTLDQRRLQMVKDRAEKYHPNTFWDVTFVDDAGSHNTMVDGPGLKQLETRAKVVHTNKLTSNSGQLDLSPLHDLLTNIYGEIEKGSNEFRFIAKTFGNSFFIGEKYPPFKKVLDALQNPIDESNEMFYNGVHTLDRKFGESLPQPQQERVNQALNYGDSQSVQKYFTDQELKDKFDLSSNEIKAYQGFVKMYKHGLDIVVKTRKLEEPNLQEGDIRNQVNRLGGYISHTRLGGDWAVYQPGDKENDPPKFFDLFKDKASAEKMSKTLTGSKTYLKTSIPRENYGRLSIHDLQSLAEAQGIDASSPDYLALKEELMKRNASKNWIRRNWIPRTDQSLKDKYDNAIDYLNGQTARYARVKGRIDSQKAFNDNSKMMTPSLARYSNHLMDIYFSGSSPDSNKIFQNLNKTVYAYRLMFKTSFFLQHLTHPISVTYPEISKGIDNLNTENIFFNAYNMSRRYALHKITGSSHGLSKETIDLMDTLKKQGYLGDQLNKFQMDSRTRFRSGFEHFLGSMARVSEGTNRIHAAMAGMLKADHMKITDPNMRLDYIKNFMKKTVFLYGKLYTPTMVTGAGNMKSLMNTMYRFRSFEVNYLHSLTSHFRYGAPAYIRAIGGMTAMAGITGAPFFALLGMMYLWKTGHTLDNDIRQSAQEANIPDKAIDMGLHGVPSLAGADFSGLIGTGDIISPYGDPLSKIGGSSVGFVEQMYESAYYASIGDRERALEKATPDFISRILRARRYSIEGIKKENGDTILANPSKFDTILSSTGIQPMDFTKAYQARDEKDAIQSGEEKRNAQYNTILAKALHDKDLTRYSETITKIQSHNKNVRDEDQVRISTSGIKDAYERMLQGKKYPRHMESVIQQINERYGIK